MKLYDRIREICDERGMSVAAFEKACGFTACSVQKWNVSVPSADKLVQAAQFLGMTVEQLLRGESEHEEVAQ